MAKKEKKVLRPMFELAKVKVLPNMGGLEIDYAVSFRNGETVNKKKYKEKSPAVPHPDLIQAIDSLDTFLARTLGLNRIDVIRTSSELTNKESDAFKALKKIIDASIKEQLDRTHATGVAISGEDKNLGVIITGKYATDSNIDVAINSPRIVLSREVYKFESELAELADRIKEEVFCYIYENKRADPELFEEEEA